MANVEKGWFDDKTKTKIIPLTQVLAKRKASLLGHVIRAGQRNRHDPMYEVTFEDDTLKPKTTAFRRAGKPRHTWHHDNLNYAWQQLEQTQTLNTEYRGLEHQRLKIKEAAIQRRYPFEMSKNEKKRSSGK